MCPSPSCLQWVSTSTPSLSRSCAACCALPGTGSSWTDTRANLVLQVISAVMSPNTHPMSFQCGSPKPAQGCGLWNVFFVSPLVRLSVMFWDVYLKHLWLSIGKKRFGWSIWGTISYCHQPGLVGLTLDLCCTRVFVCAGESEQEADLQASALSLFVTALQCVMFSVCATIPYLPLQYFTFVLQVLNRSFLYGGNAAFISVAWVAHTEPHTWIQN